MLYYAAIIIAAIAVSAFADTDADGTVETIADTAVAVVADTSRQNSHIVNRARFYDVTVRDGIAPFDPVVVSARDVFRSDGADAAEILRYRALTSVYVPFTLSGGMNRLLPYGNIWPYRRSVSSYDPFPRLAVFPRGFDCGGAVSGAQASGFEVDPIDGIVYEPYPGEITRPELHVFWENGVFDQNTFNLRLSRPLAANMMVNVFSNYRYFNGMNFDHEGNDIDKFYNTLHGDSSVVMNGGYNPLVDEQTIGASILRFNADSSKLRAAFTYSNTQNEYALNIPAPSIDKLQWALLKHRANRIDASLTDKPVWSSLASLKLTFVSEERSSSYAPDSTVATWRADANRFIFEAGIVHSSNVGFRVGGSIGNLEDSGVIDDFSQRYQPEIFYGRNLLPPENVLGALNLNLRAGLNIVPYADHTDSYVVDYESDVAAALELLNDYTRLNVYINAIGDNQAVFGAEGRIRSRHLGLLVGYQQVEYSRDPYLQPQWAYLWPGWVSPYPQPSRTIIIAPWAENVGGFSLLTRAFLTDTKPYVKASAHLSHVARPRGMIHTFETELGFDYWSERDPVHFAVSGYEWGMPIYDVNLKVTAHIRTFRLFYKVDNLLNLRQAYVPGYFSPGLTFRWGLNWFIQ